MKRGDVVLMDYPTRRLSFLIPKSGSLVTTQGKSRMR